MLRQARESAGLTQEELARRLNTRKTAISRIENHAEDIKLSTLERVAAALGKQVARPDFLRFSLKERCLSLVSEYPISLRFAENIDSSPCGMFRKTGSL